MEKEMTMRFLVIALLLIGGSARAAERESWAVRDLRAGIIGTDTTIQ